MRTVNGCILLLAAISITFAAVSGAYHLDMQQLLALILRQENVPVQEQIVFWQIRVPRILAALFLGAALAGAGTTYQGMFRNPLVSPDILGVSAGAGLGACAAILWGLSIVLNNYSRVNTCSFRHLLPYRLPPYGLYNDADISASPPHSIRLIFARPNWRITVRYVSACMICR